MSIPLAIMQVVCANFYAPTTGTYGDHCPVMVTDTTTTGSAFGVTGFVLGTSAGTECTNVVLGQTVARIDFQVAGVDPGDQVSFAMNGAAFPLLPGDLLINPDVTTQPLTASGGVLSSSGADGSAYFEMGAYLTSFEMCVTAPAGHDGVVIRPVINSFCQCGNAHKHFNEGCDDGDGDDGDGCSAECSIEPGWSCTTVYDQQSVCVAPPDAGVPDAMPPPPDAAVPDAAPPDAMPPDAGPPDAAPPDAMVPDAGPPDAFPPEDALTPPPDAAAPDATPGAVDAAAEPDSSTDLTPIDAPGCGCQGGGDGGGGGLVVWLAALGLALRRRR